MFDAMALISTSGKEAWWQRVGNNFWEDRGVFGCRVLAGAPSQYNHVFCCLLPHQSRVKSLFFFLSFSPLISVFIHITHSSIPILPSTPLLSSSVSSCRSVPGAGLHDLSWWVGRRSDPGHVRGADREILSGWLLCTLGLYAGHHGHPRRPHPLLPGLCPG